MRKEILVSVAGLQLLDEDGGQSDVEIVTPGEYYCRSGKHYILYDEVLEGMSGHVSNVIKISGNALEITKKGLMNTRMVIEEGKRHRAFYQTPFGNLELGFTGRTIRVTETGDQIAVRAEYLLDMNEEHMAECKIEMQVRPREAGNLRLQE